MRFKYYQMSLRILTLFAVHFMYSFYAVIQLELVIEQPNLR